MFFNEKHRIAILTLYSTQKNNINTLQVFNSLLNLQFFQVNYFRDSVITQSVKSNFEIFQFFDALLE